MKLSVFSVSLAAGLAAAQSGSTPKCANSCITKYTTGDEIGGCASLDVACICSNDNFLDGIACCLDANCDADGKAAAVEFAQKICAAVDVTVPNEVVCKSTSTSASASTAASASASTAASASASASASGSGTQARSSETETTASATGSATDSNETSTATQAVASSSSTDSAGTALSSAGGLLGAIFAVLAAL
ncbi:hypothetical protein B0J13DRAFT_615730 [Dactylonectria estremocensis]|uniref:CFEM domain-containing protein n=1 Tax=Dactylonectria estremocensis TaxID=1079267 RepID=A0A9P9JE54_9HYPO|nr:hypothetical protein B0J13DRAFT_615730 [Dactylonectria estremocensis]